MGTYNPSLPTILGQEWVPIRDENLQYSPAVNVVEQGHKFRLDTARQVRDARFYLNQMSPYAGFLQTALFGIYPAGTEDLTGPIQQVIIPVNSGAITGTNISIVGSVATVPAALANPGDTNYVRANFNSGNLQELSMFFATNQYPILNGKRILNVSLLYSGWAQHFNSTTGLFEPFVDQDLSSPATVLRMRNDSASQDLTYQKAFTSNTGSLDLNTVINPISGDPETGQVIGVVDLGDIFHLWSPSLGLTTNDRMPWRYQDLQRFEATAVNRLHMHLFFQVPATDDSIILNYAAMRVLYCEERRVVYGGKQFSYTPGVNIVPIRDKAHTADPSLPVGEYTATLSFVSPGDIDFGSGVTAQFPQLNACRELYAIPPHQGVQVNVPFPLEDHLGETFTKEQTHILPHLSLHATGGTPLTEVHVYGRQAIAPVYGTVTATQELLDSALPAGTPFSHTRFWARRFGDTTVPLKLTKVVGGDNATISPAAFDALPEILDGWREVNIRWDTPPTMGGGANPAWQWSATGEDPGNRWEVLAASAPAFSGIPGNLLNQVPSAQRLGTATYGQPSAGDTLELTWLAPPASGVAADPATDAALIFSQDPLTVTGVGLAAQVQALAGIGLDCGSPPCCVPTGIGYNRVTWGLPPGTGYARDGFERVVAGGWGNADIGGAYTVNVGADFSVDGASGVITPSGSGSDRFATLTVGRDFDITAEITIPDTVAGGSEARPGLVGRFTDANNHYGARFEVLPDGTTNLRLFKRVASVLTTLATISDIPLVGGSGATLSMRFVGYGTSLKVKVWDTNDDDGQPASWTMEATDTSLTTGNGAGAFARSETATGNTMTFDNLLITPPAYLFGGYELQRMDTETDWHTIMLATSPAVTGFNDYEARVGLTSTYRIRNVNLYNFAGNWSTEVTGISTGARGCSVEDGSGVLIFTSNEDQTGASNLAYVPGWERSPEETFDFPEAGDVAFQRMYGRDGPVAFHGTERGLEHFSRLVVVQQAAIDPIRLANLQSLRDLAWADLPYVCVKDDIGDRWFANVRVPGERVTHRKLYLAAVDITEVSTTPSQVNPAAP